MSDPSAERWTAGEEIHAGEDRDDDEGLQFLGQESAPDQRAGQRQPTRPAIFDRAKRCVGGRGDQQHHERIRVVEPEHQAGDRRERHHRAGEKSGGRSKPAADGEIDDRDRRHPFQRLRRQHAPGAEAKKTRRDLHHPQRAGRLVDRDEVGGVQRAEEERGPALGTRQDGGGVIRVGPARGREVPQVQQPGYAKQADQGRPRPGWILGLAAHERGRRAPNPRRR